MTNGTFAMTSGEGESTRRNEYVESFKRFKTLFIVGLTCFCLGVAVVIFGNQFQLYEVQRLGIIFSSFGIGWIILAVSYLIYMKWCFIPGESENTEHLTVGRHLKREESRTSELHPSLPNTFGESHPAGLLSSPNTFQTSQPGNIGRLPHTPSLNMFEPHWPGNERNLERHTSLGRNFERSCSFAKNFERVPHSGNGCKAPLHSERKFQKRSYSARNIKSPGYSGKSCKRLTSSFNNFERPLSLRSGFENHMSPVNSVKTTMSSEKNFEGLGFSEAKLKSPLRVDSLSLVRSGNKYRCSERPSAERGNFEREPPSKNICDMCSKRNIKDSYSQDCSTPSLTGEGLVSTMKASDMTRQGSSPPNYYEVVLSMNKENDGHE